jgi:hypothetical protein
MNNNIFKLIRTNRIHQRIYSNEKNIELVDDIYFSSELAINILNDLLQYESMDAGIFTLTMKCKPILNLFRGRLKLYFMLSRKNHLNLIIDDKILVSEYYNHDQQIVDSNFSELIISAFYLNVDTSLF